MKKFRYRGKLNYWEEKHNKHTKKKKTTQLNKSTLSSTHLLKNIKMTEKMIFFYLPKEKNTVIASNVKEEEEE